jgi:hypothetical protein
LAEFSLQNAEADVFGCLFFCGVPKLTPNDECEKGGTSGQPGVRPLSARSSSYGLMIVNHVPFTFYPPAIEALTKFCGRSRTSTCRM